MLHELSNYSLIFTTDIEYTVHKVTISKKEKNLLYHLTHPHHNYRNTDCACVLHIIFFNIYQSWNVQFQRPQSWGCRYPLYAAVPLNGGDHCAGRYVLGLGCSLFLGSGRRDFQHQKTYEHLGKKCILFMHTCMPQKLHVSIVIIESRSYHSVAIYSISFHCKSKILL